MFTQPLPRTNLIFAQQTQRRLPDLSPWPMRASEPDDFLPRRARLAHALAPGSAGLMLLSHCFTTATNTHVCPGRWQVPQRQWATSAEQVMGSIWSFDKYALSTRSMPGAAPSPGKTAMNKTGQGPALAEVRFQWEDNEQRNTSCSRCRIRSRVQGPPRVWGPEIGIKSEASMMKVSQPPQLSMSLGATGRGAHRPRVAGEG